MDNCEGQLRSCWVGTEGTLKLVNLVQRGEKKTDGSFLASLYLGQFHFSLLITLPETSLHKSPISNRHISNGMLGSQGQEKFESCLCLDFC